MPCPTIFAIISGPIWGVSAFDYRKSPKLKATCIHLAGLNTSLETGPTHGRYM